MNRVKKTILYILTIAVVIQFTGCHYAENSKPEVETKKDNVKLSEIMALSVEENGEKIYTLKDGNVFNNAKLSQVENINYNIQKKVEVYTKKIKNGINLSNNYISIDNDGKIFVIDKSFSYSDVRLSSNANYIALRSFKSDDIGTAEGLGVYSINSGKKITFDKSIIVSGDLYRWIDKDTLLYYGVEDSKRDRKSVV